MYGSRVLCSSRVVRLCSIRFYSNSGSKKLLEFLATMPKANSGRIADAQRQRQNIAKKSEKYGPSTVYLQVLGSGARGSPNTLYLFTDQKRYLFNCGECTQRLAHEHKVKLSRLDHIFITSKSWRNIGGLPGLSLTLQDVGVPHITLHGPEGLDELYNATRRFVVMKDMNVSMAKCSPAEDFEDGAMTVKYVLLGPHDTLLKAESISKDLKPAAKKPKLDNPIEKDLEEFVHDETDYYKPENKRIDPKNSKYLQNREKLLKSKLAAVDKAPDAMKKKTEKVLHDLQKKTHCTVAYICTLKKRLGTLDLAKCVEKGVKPGPMLGQLKSGQDVVLSDGTLVLSKDVKTPDDPGPVFIVLEVPDLSYLKETEFSSHFDNGCNPPENIPCIVVHYTPPHVFHHPVYRSFMQMFGPNTRHLVLNTQNSCLGSEAVHRTQNKLHLLDSEIFPLLRDGSLPAVWNSHPPPSNDSPTRRGLEDLKNKIALAQFQNIINMEGSRGDGQTCKEEGDGSKLEIVAGRTLTTFHLRPKRQLDRSLEPKLHIQDYIQETMDVDGFVASLEQFRRLVDKIRYAKGGSQKEYPKIVFLGTGSCIPSKTRNTSAIVLQVDENRSMLLDCGEGTFGQLVRFFGPKKVNAFLRTLKAVYISHLHADHHIGLIGVLQARREAMEQVEETVDPVYLLAPGQIYTWLSLYDQLFERIKTDFTLIPNQSLIPTEDTPAPESELTSAVLASIGLQTIKTCYVSHCPNAFGVAIQLDDHKITYSGDTIPCESLIALGKDSTLLIHEATMEDELVDEARIKMHSTTSQAIDVGHQMNAKYTVLTHFSQRYARLPRLNPHILNHNNSIGIAFDNMQITMGDLELLPQMYAPLQLMFAEHCVEMELKAANRAKHKARRRSSSPALTDKSPSNNNSSRKVSPGCRNVPSASLPHARYRESNASRLRQEVRGMTVTGIVRAGIRSKSSSPAHRSTPSSPTRSLHSGNLTPQRGNSEKTISLLSTPKTMSESSVSVEQPIKNGFDVGYIVDTRSKTLNTIEDVKKVKEKEKEKNQTNPSVCCNIRPNIASGYGKPLVTPINKKLTIRRDHENLPVSQYAPSKVACPRSPTKTMKLEKKIVKSNTLKIPEPTRSRLLNQRIKVDIIGSVLIHIILWRFSHIATFFFFETWPSVLAIIALCLLIWTATKETASANAITRPGSAAGRALREPIARNTSVAKPPRQISSSSIKSKSPIRLPDSKETPPQKHPQSKVLKQTVREAMKTGPLRNLSTEKLKQQFSRDMPIYSTGRPGSIHSNKSYKPQLEDIKSSYLLLNNTNAENKAKPNEKDNVLVLSVPAASKPPTFDEIKRKKELDRAKQKFQSRRFFQDSRYDKIEGLNWISWK